MKGVWWSCQTFLLLSSCNGKYPSLIGRQAFTTPTTVHDHLLLLVVNSVIVIIYPRLVASTAIVAFHCCSHHSLSVLVIRVLLGQAVSSILRFID